MIKNKTILVTGGTGSFGKKMIKTLLDEHNPKKIIVYSRDELKQHNLMQSLLSHKKKLRFFIGDVRDLPRLKKSFSGVDYVIHAAALKHVPVAEYNPFEAVKTNIIGTQNIIDASLETNIKKVISLSTDKASSPINLYGATKLTADKLIIAANNHKGKALTKFSVVRYGNVLGSRGSIVPYVLSLKKNGNLNITDKEMTRFSITLKEGVNFVIESIQKMWGGEIFIPKIKSYKLLDLVSAISKNFKIKIIGIRPGEKIHEEMISINDSLNTIELKNSYVICPNSEFMDWNKNHYKKKFHGKYCGSNFSYSSNKNKFLTQSEIKKIIDKNLEDFD